MPTEPAKDKDLTVAERELVNCVERGHLFNLADDTNLSRENMSSRDRSRTLRSWVIRDLVLGRLTTDVDPRVVRVRGARITGRLDLAFINKPVVLEFSHCFLDNGVTVRDANLHALHIHHSRLVNLTGVGLDAEGFNARFLNLRQSVIVSQKQSPAIILIYAHFRSADLSGGQLDNQDGVALDARGVQVDDRMSLTGRFRASGGIRLDGAHLGRLEFSGGTIISRTAPAIAASSMTVDGDVLLNDGFHATGQVTLVGSHIKGTLDCNNGTFDGNSNFIFDAERLHVSQAMSMGRGFMAHGGINFTGVQIDGTMDCRGAQVINRGNYALLAPRIQIGGDLRLSNHYRAVGQVNLEDAHIHGMLDCSDGEFVSITFSALNGTGVTIGRGVSLNGKFRAVGEVSFQDANIGGVLNCNEGWFSRGKCWAALTLERAKIERGVNLRQIKSYGMVVLRDTQVEGFTDCDGAILTHRTGVALDGQSLHVGGAIFIRHSRITGNSPRGAILLIAAHVGSNLECSGSTFKGLAGPALVADGMTVGGNIFLRARGIELGKHSGRPFEACGTHDLGVIRLRNVVVKGKLDCRAGVIRSDCGPALDISYSRIGVQLYLSDGFHAENNHLNEPTLNLESTEVSGPFHFTGASLVNRASSGPRMNFDGLVYRDIPRETSTSELLELFSQCTKKYNAQPYQQLAAAHRAAGHDREVRRILMAQRRDQVRRALTGRLERLWARLTGLTLGYGYQPWRALVGLFVVIAMSVALSGILGSHGGLARPQGLPAAACTLVERVGVGLDIGTPLLSTGTKTRCDTTNVPAGQVLTVAGWCLRLLAWAFATLFVAGFTGAIRKT